MSKWRCFKRCEIKRDSSSRSVVKPGVKEQRRSPNTASPRVSLWEKAAQETLQTWIHSAIYFLFHWPMDSNLWTMWTLSSNRTSYLVGLVPSSGSYTITLFFQLCECRWYGQDTKPDSVFPSLCEITEHNRAYIYTQHKSSGLAFYKSSRWQILLEGVVLPYLQHSKRKIYTFAVQTSFNASLRARGTAQMARSHTHPLFIPSLLTGV